MKLREMRECAANTLDFFIDAMPDVPFTKNGVIIEFAKKSDMAKRAVELCEMYCPDKILNTSQCHQLNKSIAANALIGREKSAVLVRIDSKLSKNNLRRILVHELMHIFCAKLEIDSEHFIDIYGSGTTPEATPENRIHDGMLVAGYSVWTEFIAQYYAIKLIDEKPYVFNSIAEYITQLLFEVNGLDLKISKDSFSMACAYWFNCTDLDDTIAELKEPNTFIPSEDPHGEETQNTLCGCINHIYSQMQNTKPWKITEEFIIELGIKFCMFRTANSFYIGIIN